MNSAQAFNQLAQESGANVLYLDENLILQKEMREEMIFWGSVYNSDFTEMPDNAITSEPAYRNWCWKTTGMMPRRRTATVFDDYIRPRMIMATERPTLAGSEYAAELDDAMEAILEFHPNLTDLDEQGPGVWTRGMMFWIETLPDSTEPELIIRIKQFMRKLNDRERHGNTEGKIRRKDVCKRLAYYGRQIGDRNATVERYRCAYALPVGVLQDGFTCIKK